MKRKILDIKLNLSKKKPIISSIKIILNLVKLIEGKRMCVHLHLVVIIRKLRVTQTNFRTMNQVVLDT